MKTKHTLRYNGSLATENVSTPEIIYIIYIYI